MKFAVSNIALNSYDHVNELKGLPELGFLGLEVALSRIWRENWNEPSPTQVDAYRRDVEAAGLRVIGLHSLFWDRPEYSLFGDAETRARTMDFLERLSRICRDLGGRTLIYGSQTARWRGDMSMEEANAQAVAFFSELCQRIEDHNTSYCFEPLETEVADYINSVLDALVIVEAVNHPALRIQMDAKALVANNEVDPVTFQAVARYLVHFHANEPDFGVLGTSGVVNHAAMGRMLHDIDYEGFVSIEQRMLNETDPLADVSASAAVLKECYL